MVNALCLRRALVLLVLLVAFGQSLARAATPEEKRVAREHFETGQVHFDLKEFDKALEAFKEAYRVIQDPVLLFNIAQCHYNLAQHEEALGFYRNFLRRADRAPNRPEVEARIVELEAIIARKRAETEAEAAASSELPAEPAPMAPGAPGPAAGGEPPALVPPPAPAPSPETAIDLTAAPADAAAEPRPIYRRWWFWTGIGAAVAVGVVTAIAVGTRGEVGDCRGLTPCHRVGGP